MRDEIEADDDFRDCCCTIRLEMACIFATPQLQRERERVCVCMGWEEEVLESANLRILCEVWISVHQSWVTTGWVPSGLRSKLFGILG